MVHQDGPLITGIVLLAESHASVHICALSAAVHADVFSCAPFEVAQAREMLLGRFGGHLAEESVLRRGAKALARPPLVDGDGA